MQTYADFWRTSAGSVHADDESFTVRCLVLPHLRIFSLILLFFVGICCFACCASFDIFDTAHAASPRARSGILDLSTWSHEQHSVVNLAGEWEFYWKALYEPSDFGGADRPQPTGFISVPGGWSGFPTDTGPLPSDGFATYRLVVGLPERLIAHGAGDTANSRHTQLALQLPWAFTAYRLWINGNLLASNGVVGTSERTMTSEFLPLIVPFTSSTQEVEIVAQVSNYMHRNGGLWNAPHLGTYDQLVRRDTFRLTLDLVVVGAVLLMALYHLAVYCFLRENRASVYIGLTGIVIGIRTLVTSEHALGRLVGGLPWSVEIRLEYMTGYLFLITFLLFIRTVFPQDASNVVVGAGTFVGVVGTIITLLVPIHLSSQLMAYYIVIFALFILHSAVTFLMAALRGREGARVLLAGGLAFTGALVHDLFHYNLLGLDIDLLPVGMVLFLFFESLTLVNRFAVTFRREVALSAENARLLDTVRAQLKEVRASRKLIVNVDEQLRRSIAERLHGHIQSRLLKAWHQIGLAKDNYPNDQQRSERILSEVQSDLDRLREEDIRQVSHLLHPSIVDIGLIPAVRSLTAEFQNTLSIDLELDEQVSRWDDPVNNRIPESVRLVAYRVLEEALSNVLAHAHANVVKVTFRMSDDDHERLTLVVSDDGRGFDPREVEHHLGLNTIVARVDSVDGIWQIQSRPGHGTVVTAHFPLPKPPASEHEDPDPAIA